MRREELLRELKRVIAAGKFIPGGRYLYASGRSVHQTQNCLLLRAEDTREGWGDLLNKVTVSLMTGAGVGVVYTNVREEGVPLRRTGGYASGPLPLMHAVNEVGRAAKQGGNRRAAIWAGLHWYHPDVMTFIHKKDWAPEIHAMKARDYNYPAPLDHTNVSVILDDDFFAAYGDPRHARHARAREVYWAAVRMACRTGDPGFSVDVGENAGESLRNACCEITSRDDSDICNLGSINMARIDSVAEMRAVTELGAAFLLAGTLYSDVPYERVTDVRRKNRRLGLGLMGLHEFSARHGGGREAYGCGLALERLKPYLAEYARSGEYASRYADDWGISRPVKTRAIAPTGTIGIVAETTTGIEPMFCAAYRRRYYAAGAWQAQYVVDPLARKMVDNYGCDPDRLEDALSLAGDPARRLAFQAHVQRYVDHAISSTLNLPQWGSPLNNDDTVGAFGEMVMSHLPNLRGVTVYPDAARGGQPLQRCSYREALAREGEVVTEQVDACSLRGGGTCGA